MHFCSVGFVMFSIIYGSEFKECASPVLLMCNWTQYKFVKTTYYKENSLVHSILYEMHTTIRFTQIHECLNPCTYLIGNQYFET